MSVTRLILVLICLWTTAASAHAEPHPAKARILADMAVLTDDAMEGRRPGTRGERRTIAALIRAFAAAGLEPAGERGWLQPVALETRIPRAARIKVRQDKTVFDLSSDIMLVGERPSMRIANARVHFAGHADHIPVRPGAVLLYHDRAPPGTALAPATDDVARRERLAASGAAMTLAIVDARFMARQRQRMPLGVIEAADGNRAPLRGYISEEAAALLMNRSATLDALVETGVRRFTSANVIGRLPGAGEPDRAVVYSAHWDAFGRCRPGEPDPICNGGIDNASGVAGMIELARWFVAGPRPDRTLIFVATTAEEWGLLGMRAYAARPAMPLSRTVAAINIDTIALYPAGQPVGFVGGGLSNLDPMVDRLARAQRRTLDTGAGPAFVAQSSDAWPMLRAGVPAFILSGAIARSGPDKGAAFQRFITERAHLPVDDLRNIELDGAIEDLSLMHALGSELASRDVWPQFLPGVRFSRPTQFRQSAEN